MASLASILLSLAQSLGNCFMSTATGGSTTTLSDSALDYPAEHFTKGTIWFISGALAGKHAVISSFKEGTFTFSTQSTSVAVGISYAVATPEYSASDLTIGVNNALLDWGEITAVDDTVAIVSGTLTYTLPTGVRDIRRVEYPYGSDYAKSYYWQEIGDKLIFDKGHAPSSSGNLRLRYMTSHPTPTTTVDIDPLIDLNRLRHSALVNILTSKLGLVHKDNPIMIELLNREIQLAQEAASRDWKASGRSMNKDPHLGGIV
jgi:hypothetical protein